LFLEFVTLLHASSCLVTHWCSTYGDKLVAR